MSYVKSVSGSDYRFLVRGVMLYHTCPWLNLLNGPLMFKRRYVTLLPLFVLLAACSSKPKPTETETTTGTPSGGFLLEPQHNVMQMGGDFANNPNAQQFIDKMVNKHGFDRQQLQEILSQAKRLDSVLRLMDNQAPTTSVKPPSGPNGAWLRYRKKFITPDNVQNGVVFWNQYEDALNRAWQVYGVPPEIIVGIIGVETRWGRVMGKTRILDALATLSFNYPRRAEYFSGELETFLLMARDEQDDPLNLKGSFAGAMGYGQFMPSSYKQYAVDFSGDGHINLWDPVDAIGSVANYFKAHGWVKGDQVAIMANGQAPGLPNGFKTKYSISQLAAAGLTPQQPLGNHQQASLLRLDVGTGYQYWYGLPNFYTITRYNHSTHYAMAVWQLGQAVALARVQ
ncbi:Membrane-bound lytic murein transglycosylase B [Shigella flexneri]|uniref:Membrane-bound lytic murein transglycosylase B n=8 Tax=Shigella flexneri TaxID=623 RepID=A0A380AVD2_SHIFL|nr:Membrane-bound lytic murein transglycosylase B,Membrane-bound lytic murein transglycosylase B precursor,murein hydrolase B,lytic murein transglycosylase B [Shigella flexneri]CEP57096.1 Membrane-bound lytic murein transglycosylase B [Shigella flexneri 2a]SRH55392.1 Membrane-bound lytic murein transglycosylase B [Shigella flexneri 2b]SPZ74632.1 Membrane-bound lytic murein transglycosylase B [Shigella flexneri]SRF76866.1 Membrane-bound lytic murein transglycosylase B [Shigella flexneri 2a]